MTRQRANQPIHGLRYQTPSVPSVGTKYPSFTLDAFGGVRHLFGVKPTTVFKQRPNDMRCVACAAAHATNTTPEEFEEFCKTYAPSPKNSAPYEDVHFGAYLASRGFLMGFGVRFHHTLPDLPIEEIYLDLGRVPITRQPAYVVVESPTRADWSHAIYWDGEQFWDSSPLTPHGLHPSKYKILSWVPIFNLL